jgi:hypothetical protein
MNLGMLTEPITMLTDYMLSLLSLWFASEVWRKLKGQEKIAALFWLGAFTFSGLAALFGGTHHGFTNFYSEGLGANLWLATCLAINCANLFLCLTTTIGHKSKVWLGIFVVKFFIFVVLTLAYANFILAALDYLLTLIVLLTLNGYRFKLTRAPHNLKILQGVIVAFVGIGIQLSGFGLHEHFNHNDIFHIIQMFSSYLFYRGCREQLSPTILRGNCL